MRELIAYEMLSLEGFYEGPGDGWQKLDWHRVDDEWNRLSIETLEAAGTVMFGRTTFEGFASFWPTQDDPIARLLTDIDKAVVSKQLAEPGWNNARVLSGDLRTDIDALKAEPGGPIILYGSGKLVQSLTALRLIDEYVFAMVPVSLGTGTPLFRPGAPRLDFALVGTKIFDNGVVMMRCRPN